MIYICTVVVLFFYYHRLETSQDLKKNVHKTTPRDLCMKRTTKPTQAITSGLCQRPERIAPPPVAHRHGVSRVRSAIYYSATTHLLSTALITEQTLQSPTRRATGLRDASLDHIRGQRSTTGRSPQQSVASIRRNK